MGFMVVYVVADDELLMKENIRHYYTELMGKDPNFFSKG